MPDNGGESIEYALPDREPVECISLVFTDMAILGDAANHPSSHPKNTIQGLQSDSREATIERGTMVDMIDYEAVYG